MGWPRVSREVVVMMWAEAVSSESSSETGGSVFEMVISQGCRQEAPISRHAGLSRGLLQCPRDMVARSTRKSTPRSGLIGLLGPSLRSLPTTIRESSS